MMARRRRLSRTRTRVIVTVGPTAGTITILRQMMAAGASVFRLNLSHGDEASHARYVEKIRKAAESLGTHVAILADLPGPKIRTGRLAEGRPVVLERRAVFSLVTRDVEGDRTRVSITYPNLWKDIRKGSRIFLDDGRMELAVTEVGPGAITTRVVVGGELDERKGVNVPGCEISRHAPTRRDLAHLDWAIRTGIDYISLSFVQAGRDIRRLRRHLRRRGADLPVVAKIECGEAVERLDEIAEEADAVMVARGDLGVELPYGSLPIIQKEIIETAARHGAIDITATQMLESMRANPRPTRAEATDVANAILDGTDALMLSGETAAGEYPVRAVKTLVEIARRTEGSELYRRRPVYAGRLDAPAEVAATVRAACAAAQEVGAKAIAVFTRTGTTARLLAELRPGAPIVALTDKVATARRLALVWGVTTFVIPSIEELAALFEAGRDVVVRHLGLKRRDTVIYTAGSTAAAGGSNLMRAETLQ